LDLCIFEILICYYETTFILATNIFGVSTSHEFMPSITISNCSRSNDSRLLSKQYIGGKVAIVSLHPVWLRGPPCFLSKWIPGVLP